MASSIDNVIANCLIRAIKYSGLGSAKKMAVPTEEAINVTRELLGEGFEQLREGLIQKSGIGSILTKEDVSDFMSSLLKSRNITGPKEVDFVVRHTINKLIASIDPTTTGILFDSTNEEVIISTLRKFLFEQKSKCSNIIKSVLKNSKGTQYLSEVFSETTIPPATKLLNCELVNLTIHKLIAEGVNFGGSTFTGSTITDSKFNRADFQNCLLDVKSFKNNQIDGTNFTNAGGYNSETVDFSNNKGKPIGLKIQKEIFKRKLKG